MKKNIITALLALSCLISGLLLLFMEPVQISRISDLEEIDEMIFEELEAYNISKEQVKVRTVEIDSSFSRKVFTISLHPSYSKTQIHQSIHAALYEYEIDSPAKMYVREDEMSIYLYSDDTVFRTIRLLTDNSRTEENNEEADN